MAERLPAPVRETLDAELDEADIPRLWRGVEARRERRRHRHFAVPGFAAQRAGLGSVLTR